jgi:WD40 repeat protein
MTYARMKSLVMKAVASLARHTYGVWSVAFSPDEQHIVSGSGDNLVGVCVWREGGCVACQAGHSGCSVGRLQS